MGLDIIRHVGQPQRVEDGEGVLPGYVTDNTLDVAQQVIYKMLESLPPQRSRKCRRSGCETILSSYNPRDTCFIHSSLTPPPESERRVFSNEWYERNKAGGKRRRGKKKHKM